jgi:hypothetical protein
MREAMETTVSQVTLDAQFNGPPRSGNGGYACGVVAEAIDDGIAEVTLRRPLPLEIPLSLVSETDGTVTLSDSGGPIAVGTPAALDIDIPAPPSFDDAVSAAGTSPRLKPDAPFPTCFVCGGDREEGDGLRIFPGAVPGREMVACPWIPHPAFADGDGNVLRRHMWAVLDCPSAAAFFAKEFEGPILLARMTARLSRPVQAGEKCVMIAWTRGEDGRKMSSASALFSEQGDLCGVADCLWIAPKR